MTAGQEAFNMQTININRLKERLDKVNEIGAMPVGGVKRLALTDEDKLVRDLLKKWFDELNLTTLIDQAGNMVGTWKISNQNPVAIGSHLDTVGTGGLFDGSLGVVAGLEVLQTIIESGIKINKPLSVINFTNEEGVRFTPDMMGSYAFAGLGKIEDIWSAKAEENQAINLIDELKRTGYLGEVKCGSVNLDSYFELHIEQGPVLEAENIQIGVVEKVQGINWTEYVFKGKANHAGTTPMRMRRDAGYVAASVSKHVRELTREIGGAQVGTVGITEAFPNLINVIPERVRVTVDLRNTDKGQLLKAQRLLDEYVSQVSTEENVAVDRNELVRFDPVNFDPDMVNLIEQKSKALGYSSMRMPSGAGHDAQMMASICSTAMIFIQSKDGISHNIDEFSSDDAIEAGANVLLNAVLEKLTS